MKVYILRRYYSMKAFANREDAYEYFKKQHPTGHPDWQIVEMEVE